ncbi:MAG: fusA [Caulobacter sp.]|nr:fusA [Caulobacter sp.]
MATYDFEWARSVLCLVELAVEPATDDAARKLDAALFVLTRQDSGFGAFVDPATGQLWLEGQGEPHLSDKLDTLLNLLGVDLVIGPAQVTYRETITQAATVDLTHNRPKGLKGEFARVILAFEPGATGSGFRFENAAPEDVVPEVYASAVEQGLETARAAGLLAGFPVIDLTARLIGGAAHDVDSSPAAFEIAAASAFEALRDRAAPALLQPIMRLAAAVSLDQIGPFVADLNARGGHIIDSGLRGDQSLVVALAPLASLFGYGPAFTRLTDGQANCTMAFDHFGIVEAVVEGQADAAPVVGARA